MIDPTVRRVLDGTSIAHLATILPDGSPHSTPVYVGTHGEHVVFFTGPGMRKARNLRRDPRLAISIAPVGQPLRAGDRPGAGSSTGSTATRAWEIIDRLAVQIRRRARIREVRSGSWP